MKYFPLFPLCIVRLVCLGQLRLSDIEQESHRLIFFGPPGSGKGTQASLLQTNSTIGCHLSTGELLRTEVNRVSPLGLQVRAILDGGGLVPDEIVIDLVRKKMVDSNCFHSFILDGFPRTVSQAQKLDEMLRSHDSAIDQVVYFQVSDEVVMERLGGRLIHVPSGRTYHAIYAPPKIPGLDDFTGEPLIKRSDDAYETIRLRLMSYHTETEPVLAYYTSQDMVTHVDASQPPHIVHYIIKTLLSDKLLLNLNRRTPFFEPFLWLTSFSI
eukprot:TRINITY_DN20598_c0_g1::TRINITY_DN20598_c0_g1_i1::g.12350::m.12350 TRINITY_DN20598_c0_g1::TRINITY_DN20598_c0_g1_i1::g.12350  ORF type:complete len:269 (-),score=2.45,sp/Q08480/KAD4_ORYSJ/45.29/2e-70,ADK/PF00406.17/1.2e-48,ADK_lid/PF05191.9/5.5e-11,ADK_lid/PF05191.9/3.8e+03,AAA_33/PF13671.1/1.4e-05,AAA_17/PF13207.1/0.0023,AAA_18/PF13238.1/0.094,Mg_chelatase/PF01078.16/0.04,RuvB_N/PF05496.7/0.19 TRINITY_DN20598_c0_g1_i1:316-1122(-)